MPKSEVNSLTTKSAGAFDLPPQAASSLNAKTLKQAMDPLAHFCSKRKFDRSRLDSFVDKAGDLCWISRFLL